MWKPKKKEKSLLYPETCPESVLSHLPDFDGDIRENKTNSDILSLLLAQLDSVIDWRLQKMRMTSKIHKLYFNALEIFVLVFKLLNKALCKGNFVISRLLK